MFLSNKARVLVVDDEQNIRTALEFLISNHGYEVQTAASGEEAMKKIPSFRPNAIILDVMMPGMNGYDVAKKIRSDESLYSSAILFLTAKGEPADRMNGYSSGGEIYLTKPFDNDELLDAVDELVSFQV